MFVKKRLDFYVIEEKNGWCGRGDLNPHTRNALPPQGSVSTVPPRPRKE